jgi:predicted RecA/RadA family phage recombinase
MAKNVIFEDGNNLSLPVKADTQSGDPVLVSADLTSLMVGVALTDEGEGGNPDGYATVQCKGVVDIPVTGAVTVVGAPVYITAANVVNVTNTNVLYGYALETKGASASVIRVRIK